MRVLIRSGVIAAALAVAVAGSGCGSSEDAAHTLPAGPSYAGSPVTLAGLEVPARAQGADIALAVDGGFKPRFWPGVNLGATVPGTLPGELAPARADYDRWLKEMGALGVRLLRVYTILPPPFYDSFAAYNKAHGDRPIHLLQGVWIPEDGFVGGGDAYAVLDDWKPSSGMRCASCTAMRTSRSGPATRAAGNRRRLPLAAGLVARRRVGLARGPLDRPQERGHGAVRGPVHPRLSRRHADGELDRRRHGPRRDTRGAPWLEPADHLHQLADRGPLAPPRRADPQGGHRLGRPDAHPRHRRVAGGRLRQLPRLPVLPRLPALASTARPRPPTGRPTPMRATCAHCAPTTAGCR